MTIKSFPSGNLKTCKQRAVVRIQKSARIFLFQSLFFITAIMLNKIFDFFAFDQFRILFPLHSESVDRQPTFERRRLRPQHDRQCRQPFVQFSALHRGSPIEKQRLKRFPERHPTQHQKPFRDRVRQRRMFGKIRENADDLADEHEGKAPRQGGQRSPPWRVFLLV